MNYKILVSTLNLSLLVSVTLGMAQGTYQALMSYWLHHRLWRLVAEGLQPRINFWLLLLVPTSFFLTFVFHRAGKLPSKAQWITAFAASWKNARFFIWVAVTLAAGLYWGRGRALELPVTEMDFFQIFFANFYPMLVVGVTLWGLWKLAELALDVPAKLRFLPAGFAAGLVALWTNIWVGLYQGPLAATGPNVLILSVDCLRPDHLGAYGYERNTSPTIDQLALESTVFKNAYSTAPWTAPSVATLFTGLHPNAHQVRSPLQSLPSYIPTLSSRLRNAGYETLFMNGGNTFIRSFLGFARGFDRYAFIFPIDGERLTETFLGWLTATSGAPFFAYLHYMDLHVPYNQNRYNALYADLDAARPELLPEQILVGPVRQLSENQDLTEQDRNLIVDLYDGQIRFVDSQVQRIVSTLRQNGMWTETLFILTADHGEEFWEHGNFEHGHVLYDEVVRVPLILHGSRMPSRKVSTPVSMVDVMPTILEVAGQNPTSFPQHGHSLTDLMNEGSSPGSEELYFSSTLYGTEKFGMISNGTKIILNTDDYSMKLRLVGPKPPETWELYNLSDDPGEQVNQMPNHPEPPEYRTRLLEFSETFSAVTAGAVEVDEDTRKELRTLGYIQ